MRVPSSVQFEFRVHVIENKEADAGLDTSFEFLFVNNFAIKVILGIIKRNLRGDQCNSSYILYKFTV